MRSWCVTEMRGGAGGPVVLRRKWGRGYWCAEVGEGFDVLRQGGWIVSWRDDMGGAPDLIR